MNRIMEPFVAPRKQPVCREKRLGSLGSTPLGAAMSSSAFVDERYPGGQSYRDCVELMRSFLEDVVPQFDGRRVLVIAHSAQRWALRHLLEGVPLEELVDAPFEWQEGWEYVVGPPDAIAGRPNAAP